MEKELRKGNLITDKYWEDFKTIITVESIGEKGINLYASDNGKPYGLHSGTIECEHEFEELCGILLTEQWLIDFGFEKITNESKFSGFKYYHYKNKECWIYLIKNGFELELITGNERHNLCRTYQYVHQLQNLYFALTGIELLTNKNQK